MTSVLLVHCVLGQIKDARYGWMAMPGTTTLMAQGVFLHR